MYYGGSCLATDGSKVLTVGCGSHDYGLAWMELDATGAWTTISSPKGCYLKVAQGAPVCRPGFQGDDAQWRMIRTHWDHHMAPRPATAA
ncbi:hypothetical protein AB0F71_18410 [Kitasatospora sp. NPDC028055]|uniref:hypothetical protein n=1 Tax=Kitasatospora sp. NPDC028055 TaxID=3155653 RepID=UPI003408BE87